MKLGILSESHGSVFRTKEAINLLLSNLVQTVIHCGDIGSENVVIELQSRLQPRKIPFYAVLGNVDFPDDEFNHLSIPGQFEILGRFGEITIADNRIAITHGDDSTQLIHAIKSENYDYVFTGHTHQKEDRRCGKTRLINPGAVYRASEPSVAVLDLTNGNLEFLPIC